MYRQLLLSLCLTVVQLANCTCAQTATDAFIDNDDKGPSIRDKGPRVGPRVRKWALLIGVSEFRNLDPLSFPKNDAHRMYQVLTENCGFEPRYITLITDEETETARRPLKYNVENQLGRVLGSVEPQDHVLVFFAGHGYIDSDGEGYLATQESDLQDLKRTAVAASFFMQRLERVEAAQKLLFLDCCQARNQSGNASAKSDDTSSNADSRAGKFASLLPAQFSQTRGLVTFASCSPGESSSELFDGKNGVFTHFLTQGMSGESDNFGNGNGKVELSELISYTTDKAAKETIGYVERQTPKAYFGPHSIEKTDVIADQAEPFLIKSRVGDQWRRKLKIVSTYRLQKDGKTFDYVMTRDLDADHNIRLTIPAGRGRPQGSIATYNQDRKSLVGRKHRVSDKLLPESISFGELGSMKFVYSVSSLGSDAKVFGMLHAKVPSLASVHPVELDEAILPMPGTNLLDSNRILNLLEKLAPNSDPVFEVKPELKQPVEGTVAGQRATQFEGTAELNARIGTAEGHNVRMRFRCKFKVVYSHEYEAVIHAECNAISEPFQNLNNKEILQLTVDIQSDNERVFNADPAQNE